MWTEMIAGITHFQVFLPFWDAVIRSALIWRSENRKKKKMVFKVRSKKSYSALFSIEIELQTYGYSKLLYFP